MDADKRFVERRSNPELAKSIPTGYYWLDKCRVLTPGSTTTLGGETSMGKSIFVNNIVYNILTSDHVVLGFSLESNEKVWTDRFLCSQARVYASNWRDGKITEEQYVKYSNFSKNFLKDGHAKNLYIDAKGEKQEGLFTVDYIINKIKAHQLHQKVDVVFIDYLQKLTFFGRNESIRVNVINAMNRFFSFAKSNNIAMILVSQLNRTKDGKEAFPTLERLAESGAIEQCSDSIVFIHRMSRTHPIERKKGVYSVPKNREGEPAMWSPLTFDDRYLLFIEDLAGITKLETEEDINSLCTDNTEVKVE
jgi:replicative DNA helicase